VGAVSTLRRRVDTDSIKRSAYKHLQRRRDNEGLAGVLCKHALRLNSCARPANRNRPLRNAHAVQSRASLSVPNRQKRRGRAQEARSRQAIVRAGGAGIQPGPWAHTAVAPRRPTSACHGSPRSFRPQSGRPRSRRSRAPSRASRQLAPARAARRRIPRKKVKTPLPELRVTGDKLCQLAPFPTAGIQHDTTHDPKGDSRGVPAAGGLACLIRARRYDLRSASRQAQQGGILRSRRAQSALEVAQNARAICWLFAAGGVSYESQPRSGPRGCLRARRRFGGMLAGISWRPCVAADRRGTGIRGGGGRRLGGVGRRKTVWEASRRADKLKHAVVAASTCRHQTVAVPFPDRVPGRCAPGRLASQAPVTCRDLTVPVSGARATVSGRHRGLQAWLSRERKHPPRGTSWSSRSGIVAHTLPYRHTGSLHALSRPAPPSLPPPT
jgi:hypothetical protein